MAKRAKQSDLPGMEERHIDDLHKAALDYVAVRDVRMSLTEQEVPAKARVLEMMRKHKKDKYICEGVEIERVPGEETVKVKVHKAAAEEAKDEQKTPQTEGQNETGQSQSQVPPPPDESSEAKSARMKGYWAKRKEEEKRNGQSVQ
jgi:hypothetical protein